MTKYQKYFQEMLDENHELFDEFTKIHAQYIQDSEKHQEEFNQIGEKVVAKIREFEVMLCARANSGQYSKYSSNLADKFWEAVREYYPKIDFVGVK